MCVCVCVCVCVCPGFGVAVQKAEGMVVPCQAGQTEAVPKTPVP